MIETDSDPFEILGISPQSNKEDINRAHRNLTTLTHPDITGDDGEQQTTLNLARSSALEIVKQREVLLNELKEIVKNENSAQNILARKQAAIQSSKKFYTKLTRLKNLSYFMGVASAAIAFLKPDLFSSLLSDSSVVSLSVIMTFLAGMTALFGFAINLRISRSERLINDVFNILSDRRRCAARLAWSLNYCDLEKCTEREFFEASRYFLQSYYHRKSFFKRLKPWYRANYKELDYLSIVVDVSVSHGLIKKTIDADIRPDSSSIYELQFRPSNFVGHKEKQFIKNYNPKADNADSQFWEFFYFFELEPY